MHMMHGMKMYFHGDLSDTNILIYGWNITDGGRLTGTMIAFFLLGAFYEWIKFVRVMHFNAIAQQTRNQQIEDVPWSKRV